MNRRQALDPDWYPPDLEKLGSGYTSDPANHQLRAQAATQFKRMVDDVLDATGSDLQCVSPFRSFSTQCTLFGSYASNDGCEEANTYSAMAGHSEHQLGTVCDIGTMNGEFIDGTQAHDRWLEDNAHLYGFAMSYPDGTTGYTGYIHEPWHFRFIGVTNATRLRNLQTQLGRKISVHEFIAEHLN